MSSQYCDSNYIVDPDLFASYFLYCYFVTKHKKNMKQIKKSDSDIKSNGEKNEKEQTILNNTNNYFVFSIL